MKIVVAASDEQWIELTEHRSNINWERVDDAGVFIEHANADAFFSLKNNTILPEFKSLKKPVLINSVVHTIAELAAPINVFRINGWKTFLNRTTWEIAGTATEIPANVFNLLNIYVKHVKDEPGFISARIISMIINEGYFALEDNVSTKAEIDTAMKLGTNYPFGPFEWAQLIGLHNIVALLQKLHTSDIRYQPSELLICDVNVMCT